MSRAEVAPDESLPIRNWTVGDLLDRAASTVADHIAIKERPAPGAPSLIFTYADLVRDTRCLASALLARFAPGEHIAIWGSNSTAWTLWQLAAARAGLVLVTLNPALKAREAEALLRQSQSVGVLMDREYRGIDLPAMVEEIQPRLPFLREMLQIDEWRTQLGARERPLPPVEPNDAAMILYTSGTTGAPKGVVLRHEGIVNNALLGSDRYELADGLVWLGVLPLFHVGGAVTTTLGCISKLGTNIVVPAFEAGLVIDLMATERVAMFPVVPTMIYAMLEHETFATADLSSLQLLLTGGTTIAPEFVRLVRDRFGVDVQVMFGQTESSGAISKTYRSDSIKRIARTVGRPYPHTALRIAGIPNGETVTTGVPGEIRIRSPFMTREYFDNPEATAAAFDSEGFLRTGDVGTLDADGYLSITGRLKEMIIRGGENIYPREIEDTLGEFPGVLEVAVVGLPHPRWGEEVAAAVRCSGAAADPEALREFLLTRLARHKVPKQWRIVDDFPRTPSGKIQKLEVARWFHPPS